MDITTTPIADLSATISYSTMESFIYVMFALVIVMTLVDVWHKKSMRWFNENVAKGKLNATKDLSAGDKVGIAVSTIVVDVLSAGEFCNFNRKLAHLLTMYGFILFNAMTAIIIFSGAAEAANTLYATLWHVGAIMLAVGGWWFWLFIRVDVAAEGNKWYNISAMDMFSISLIATSTFALIWSYVGGGTGVTFGLFILSAVSLFGGVLWSKFAHMFFKPFAAYEKRTTKANGSAMNLPTITRDDPEQQKRHSMELLVDAPMNMGLGIKREAPKHY
jgi:hypothetical protein